MAGPAGSEPWAARPPVGPQSSARLPPASPPAGHPWRYCEEQIAYHYTADRDVLLQAVARRHPLAGGGSSELSPASHAAMARLVLSA